MEILKIGAVWCSGCIVMKPIWKEIEEEDENLDTKYYDYDENSQLLKDRFGDLGNLPCFIFLDNKGELLEKINGEFSKKELLEKINKYRDK